MADWRCIAYVCGTIHLIFTAIFTGLMFFDVLEATGVIGGKEFTEEAQIIYGCSLLLSMCQEVVDVFLIISTKPYRILQNRSLCFWRVLAFLIYSALHIGFQFGAGSGKGEIEYYLIGGGSVGLILVALCVPHLLELKKPAQVQVQQTPSRMRMGDPNNLNPARYSIAKKPSPGQVPQNQTISPSPSQDTLV